MASRQRRWAARSEQPDPWDGLQDGEPTPQPAEEPAPAGGAERRDPPLVAAHAPSHEADPPENLAAHVARDAALFRELGWRGFVEQRRTATDFASLANVDHPARRLLQHYKARGAPVKMMTEPCSRERVDATL